MQGPPRDHAGVKPLHVLCTAVQTRMSAQHSQCSARSQRSMPQVVLEYASVDQLQRNTIIQVHTAMHMLS